MTDTNLDPRFLETLILKGITNNKIFLVLCSNVFEKEYFDNSSVGEIFNFSKSYIEEYRTLPPKEVIINSIGNDGVKRAFEEADGIDFDIIGNYDYLIEQTNIHLKNQAIKKALLDSVSIYESGENLEQVREKIETALTKDLKINLGLDYFIQLQERLRKIFNATESNRVKTYFNEFDEIINGGFPPFTLSVICARIHGFKCVNKNTKITVKNKKTGFIENTRIQDFFNRFDPINKYIVDNNKEKTTMIGLEGLKRKYGEEEGQRRYDEFRRKISESSKNRNTLPYFKRKYGEEEGQRRYDLYIKRQKKSQSLKGYIQKYGEEEGQRKWDKRIKKHSKSQTIEGYIDRYGEEKGKKKFEERQEKWQNTINSKSPEEIERINELKKNKVENFIQKYGEEEGIKKWIERNEKQSKSMSKVDAICVGEYIKYTQKVRRISNRNIKIHGLEKLELRSREYHLDHKVSICYGFNKRVSPEIIGSIYNLEIISANENCSKQDKNSIKLKELMEVFDENR